MNIDEAKQFKSEQKQAITGKQKDMSNIDAMDAEKLHDTLTTNETKFPEIFDLSEEEVIKIMNAAIGYVQLGSYQDWLRMYNGIHHESTFEAAIKHWLACVRWMKQSKQTV